MFLAGLPLTIVGLSLTLHVLNDLGRGYVEAGLVGSAVTVGSALGSPSVGRMIDGYGLRPVVAVCGISSTAVWCALPYVPYAALVVLALPAGMITVPMGSLARQFLAALVPEEQRRAAYSLDTILAEVSFIIGPALGMLVIITFSPAVALIGVGIWRALSCFALYVVNWPTRRAGEPKHDGQQGRPPLRSWLSGRLLGALLVSIGSLFVLGGTELAVVAVLRARDEVALTGVVIGGMAVASIVGGMVHGAVRRSWSQGTLAMLLSLLLMPVGLFDQSWWLLLIVLVPMNLLCAPTLAAGSEAVANLAPPLARGEAMGLLDAATKLGLVLASPLVGLAIDCGSPAWGFVAAGLGGVLFTCLGSLCHQRPSTILQRGARTSGACGPAPEV
jgi:MFS family permease